MYKLTILPSGATNESLVIRIDGNVFIPADQLNRDYQVFLDDINEYGVDIIEGDIPEKFLEDAATKLFNNRLAAYIQATSRLNQYILSEGRIEVKEMLPSGEQRFNEQTREMEDVLVETVTQTAIEPLPPLVTIVGENEEIVEVRNPLIVQDEEERAAAQAIVDATPEEVKAAA